jgi:hypothetical protein
VKPRSQAVLVMLRRAGRIANAGFNVRHSTLRVHPTGNGQPVCGRPISQGGVFAKLLVAGVTVGDV